MNFEIAFTPVYRPGVSLSVSVDGAVLSINGDAIDLSSLEDGDMLPDEAADALHRFICYAPIERVGNVIHLTLAQPYDGHTEAWDGPPITVLTDGPVALPFPSEGEPISGGATIVVDGDTIIRAATKAAELSQSAINAVKAECGRRILEVMPSHKQINSLALHAEASMMHGPNPTNWPPELQAEQGATMPLWAEIKRLRARSGEIEAMDPIPSDVTDDALWA